MPRQLISILTIAGSDCSGGAGIQADIRAASLCGVYATSVVTAVTTQNSNGIRDIVEVNPESVIRQLECVFEESAPQAIKIGMLGSLEIGETVVAFLRDNAANIPIVVDPVMSATAGGNLTPNSKDIVSFYTDELSPVSTIVTPNIPEAERFGCLRDNPDDTAMALLYRLNCMAVVLKGGHSDGELLSDILAVKNQDGKNSIERVTASRIECHNLHGTGCTFSSMLAAELAKGNSITDAFHTSSWKMKTLIADSRGYSLGHSRYGPLNMFDYATRPT